MRTLLQVCFGQMMKTLMTKFSAKEQNLISCKGLVSSITVAYSSLTSIERPPLKRPPSIKRPFFKVPNYFSVSKM